MTMTIDNDLINDLLTKTLLLERLKKTLGH